MLRKDTNKSFSPVASRLFKNLSSSSTDNGAYDEKTQTWSHREGPQLSPNKNNQEN